MQAFKSAGVQTRPQAVASGAAPQRLARCLPQRQLVPACQGRSSDEALSRMLVLQHGPAGALSRRVVVAQTSSFASAASSGEETDAMSSFDEEVMDFGYCSAQGVRDTMEDELQVYYNEQGRYLYAAVFDGHGGDQAAQWLSKSLHTQLDKTIRTMNTSEECPKDVVARPAAVTKQLVEGFVSADRTLIKHLRESGGDKVAQAGATATVAVIKDGRLFVANVGDSNAVLCRHGVGVPIAHIHRVYGSGPDVSAEMDRVKSTGGWVDDGRVCGVLAVSRAFGDWEFKGDGLPHLLRNGIQKGYWDDEFARAQKFSSDPVVCTPDVTETVLTSKDEFVVVASDGLWDVMTPAEAVSWARREFKNNKASAKKVAESLCEIALKRYSTDNIAVVVVDLRGPSHWEKKTEKKPRKPMFGGLFNKKK